MDPDKLVFKQEIQQMMYVAGETQDPPIETLALVEEIIRQQVVHMLTTANALANRRGARLFSNNDIIFQFRHDTARLERLRAFLTWKVIRKTVKNPDDKDAHADEAAMEDEAAGASLALPPDRMRIPTVSFPWDVESFFAVQVPGAEAPPESLSNAATMEKLQQNDERTRGMTAEEYKTWSEYRHASFTWHKAKRFREWAGLGVIADHRATDDVLDILGFLTTEAVQRLTVEALRAQHEELLSKEGHDGKAPVGRQADGLFAQSGGSKQPVEARHIRTAFQRLQSRPKRPQHWRHSTSQSSSTGLILI